MNQIITLSLLFVLFVQHVAPSADTGVSCLDNEGCWIEVGAGSECVINSTPSVINSTTSVINSTPSASSNSTSNSTAGTCVCGNKLGQSCLEANCCAYDYLVCSENYCKCIYDDYCWLVSSPDGDAERAEFQRLAQCILAVGLLLTASVLIIIFWNAFNRRKAIRRRIDHQMPADSFMSLNSIQRLVLMQLQDRPPPYNAEEMKPSKDSYGMAEPPPSYLEAVGVPIFPEGVDNQAFVSGDHPMTSTAFSDTLLQNLHTNHSGFAANHSAINETSASVSSATPAAHLSEDGLERRSSSHFSELHI